MGAYQPQVPNDSLTVLFNTEEAEAMTRSAGSVTHHFEPTKTALPTYLVAVVVGRLDFIEARSNNVDYRIYTPVGKSSHGQFALNVSTRIVEHFGSIWGSKYVNLNSKMYQVSVPGIQDDASTYGLWLQLCVF